MAGALYVLDSNILIRWVQPCDPGYPIVESALEALANQAAILCCYTSQNVAEFWSACTRPADRNGYGLLPQQTSAHGCFGFDLGAIRVTEDSRTFLTIAVRTAE
jgi:hypothetical protein